MVNKRALSSCVSFTAYLKDRRCLRSCKPAVIMPPRPSQFQRAKPRPKTKPAKRVILSDEEKRKIEDAATQSAKKDETYTRHLPTDMSKR
jgi:hypothetical protein